MKLTDEMVRRGQSIHYRVNNDSVVRDTFGGAINIGTSEGGHSSRSFLESRVDQMDYFKSGLRKEISGDGYQDPLMEKLSYPQIKDLFTPKALNESIFLGQDFDFSTMVLRGGREVDGRDGFPPRRLPPGMPYRKQGNILRPTRSPA